jgi:hypothetical protein
MSPSAHTRVRHVLSDCRLACLWSHHPVPIGLVGTLLMLAVEALDWSRLCIAGLCGIGEVLAWLVRTELANDQSNQD